LLSLVWTVWVWWAPLVSGVVMIAAYLAMVGNGSGYGDLVEVAFGLHRWKLYEALKWPAPASPADGHAAGAALTEYSWRGSDDETPKFGGEPEATPGLRERPRVWLCGAQP
jgi:hypothetical protein